MRGVLSAGFAEFAQFNAILQLSLVLAGMVVGGFALRAVQLNHVVL